ncbi:hypothetical protein BpHYR1_024677 [Brachionus plicatilis]|uniref:Uncharacterized protein n=1 Tax=Brachionus plicatilis TaxID=10195 RepID=A0A3M7SCW5_BRAPC|nr:hypothetical protein BpHYR1_024677 [Brachionus plicatilis]
MGMRFVNGLTPTVGVKVIEYKKKIKDEYKKKKSNSSNSFGTQGVEPLPHEFKTNQLTRTVISLKKNI